MAHITIRNFGPIESISIPLHRIMLLMGPQSSGKSTVAKLISSCLWIEKDVVFHHTVAHVNRTYIQQNLLAYHDFGGYLRDEWSLDFVGDVLRLHVTGDEIECTPIVDLATARLSKNIYVPAERTCVAIKGLEQFKMDANYQRSFIFEWLGIRSRVNAAAPYSLHESVGLAESFYYDDTSGDARIKVNEDGDTIDFASASSGLKSLIPLLLPFDYMLQRVYESREAFSYDKKEKIKDVLLDEVIRSNGVADSELPAYRSSIGTELIAQVKESMEDMLTAPNTEQLPDSIRRLIALRDQITTPEYTNVVIEEPDQNIFPQTQIALTYYMMRQAARAGARLGTMVITTHSPFILYALNNCLLGHSVSDTVPEALATTMSRESWTDPACVGIYEIKDGYVVSPNGQRDATIQNERGLVTKNYFDTAMGGIMKDFRNLLSFAD